MPALMRFDGAVVHSPAIDRWLDNQPPELGSIARRWFHFMRQCGGDVRELMHDGYPTVCVGDAAFAYVGVFRFHVNVGFFCGATLPDPAGLLVGTGKRMRHIKIKPDARVDRGSIEALISAAYREIHSQLMAES